MLATISCREPDHVPCCFMLYKALQEQCADQREFIERQLALGLDAVVHLPVRVMRQPWPRPEQGDLRGLPVRFGPKVEVRDWRQDSADTEPALHRQYVTPSGNLYTCVTLTEDYVHNDRIAIFDDYVIPRARKRLVRCEEDFAPLRHLLAAPTNNDIAEFRDAARSAKALAAKRGLLVAGEQGVLFDAACWLCGIEELMFKFMEAPEFVEELFDIIGAWNRRRMEIVLDEGIDLFIKRAWYETADFLSPDAYRRFILPIVKSEVRLAHEAGAKFACITTSSYTPFLDLYLDSEMDVLIGLDPVQDARADFAYTKRNLAGRMCLWGGVNGCVTVEMGTEEEVRNAVRDAMRVLAPGGGFILSPIDNVRVDTDRARANVRALIDEGRSFNVEAASLPLRAMQPMPRR